MPRRLPSLNALRAFEAAARHLSVSRAADELCVTHGAVSRQVKALEAQLGAPLFRRGGGRIGLTGDGEALAATARAAFDLLEAGASRFGGPRRGGTLVLSCWSTFMMRWLIPRLHRFAAQHPAIQFRLSASCEAVDFDRDQVDVAIRLSPPATDERVVATRLFDEAFGPLCSPDLLRTTPLDGPEQLVRHRLLVADTRPAAWPEWQAAAGLAPRDLAPAQRFEHSFYMLEAAAAGLGVAIGSRTLAAGDLAGRRLVAPFGFVPSGQSAYLIYPKRSAREPGLLRFRDWILAELARDAPSRHKPESSFSEAASEAS